MDQSLRYIATHPRRVIVGLVLFIVIMSGAYFFSQNSLVLVTVSSAGKLHSTSGSAAILADQKDIGSIRIGGQKLLVIANKTSSLEASTGYESTIIEYGSSPFFSKKTLSLTPQVADKKLSADSGSCIYASGSSVTSWNCDTLESHLQQIDYRGASFPLNQPVTDFDDLSYMQPYDKGFIAIGGGDSMGITYVDLSSAPIAASSKLLNTSLEESPKDSFSYSTTQIIIDPANPAQFAVVDTNTWSYKFFKDGFASSPATGKLSLPNNNGGVYQVAIYDGVVSVLNSQSTDSQDEHGDASKTDLIEPTLIRFDANTGIKKDSISFDESFICNSLTALSSQIVCQDSNGVSLYDLSSGKRQFTLSEAGSPVVTGGLLYVTYRSGVYSFDPTSRSLHAVFSIPGRSVGSLSVSANSLVAGVWFDRIDNSPQRITYSLDTTKPATYPRIDDKLPLKGSESSDVIASDYVGNVIFINLIIPGKEYIYGQPAVPEEVIAKRIELAKNKTLNTLAKKGIDTNKYRVSFYY